MDKQNRRGYTTKLEYIAPIVGIPSFFGLVVAMALMITRSEFPYTQHLYIASGLGVFALGVTQLLDITFGHRDHKK